MTMRIMMQRSIYFGYNIFCLLLTCFSCAVEEELNSFESSVQQTSNSSMYALPQKADSLVNENTHYWLRLLQKDKRILPILEESALEELDRGISNESKITKEFDLNTKEMFSKGNLKYRIVDHDDLVLRIDELAFSQDIQPFKIFSSNQISHMPLTFKSNQKLKITRVYANERDAFAAQSLKFDQLPLNAMKAKKLEKDTLVDIPIEAMISINANGNWLTKNYQKQENLKQLISFSTLTHLKANTHGMILVKGLFRLQLIKLNDDWIRVKLLLDRTQEWNAQAEIGAFQQLKAVLIPATQLEKLKTAYLQQSAILQKPQVWFKKIDQRMDELKFLLSQSSRQIADLSKNENKNYQKIMDYVGAQTDQLLDIIDQGQIRLEDINDLILEKTNQSFGIIQQNLQTKIAQLESYTRRSLDFNSRIELNAKVLDELFFLADFKINVATEDGALLYDHLFSGSLWEGINPIQFFGEQSLQQIDFSLLQEASKHSDVIQVDQTLSGMHQSNTQEISIKTPIISTSFGQKKISKKIKRQNATLIQNYAYEDWGRFKEIKGILLDEGESISCGSMQILETQSSSIREVGNNPNESDQLATQKAFYWMSWHQTWHMFESDPLIKSIDESIRLTGRLANFWQIPQIYYEQVPGHSQSDIQMIFSKDLLDQIFSLDSAMIWQVLALVAENFDNQFGIPYLSAWQAPNLDAIASQHCEVIAYHWGLQYCHILNDELIIPIQQAQMKNQNLDFDFQKEILKNFYTKTLLNNWTSARLVTRFLSEMAVEIGAEQEVQFLFKHQHPLMPSVVTIDQIGEDDSHFQMLNLINPM